MGRKPNQDKKEEAKPEKEKAKLAKPEEATKVDEEKPEDTPIVKELKVLDDKYLVIEREYEKEVQALQLKYSERQQPLLEERTKLLVGEAGAGPLSGTPALAGFWLQACKNHPAMEDSIEEHDEPVLEFLRDITKDYLDKTDLNKGFRLNFHFVENPYFTNSVITKEYHTEEESPYTGDMAVKEVKASEIDWKPGKDVTVEKVSAKVKGGGAKKQKQKGKEKLEPRDSFFRHFFRSLSPGMPVPDDVNLDMDDMSEEAEDEDQIIDMLMENDFEIGQVVKDQIIPFAVRWYTGEAAPDDSDDDDDEDEEEEEEDEEDEESDDEPKKKGGRGKKDKGKKPKIPDVEGGGEKKEECKQQ